MKKQILNLGKLLNKAAQKEINGGNFITTEGDPCHVSEGQPLPGHCACSQDSDCASGACYSPGPGAANVCY